MIATQLELAKLTVSKLRNMKKEELNKKVTSWDGEKKWKEEAEKKLSLKIHKR